MPASTLALDRVALDDLLLRVEGCEVRIRQIELATPRLTLEGRHLRLLETREARLNGVDIVVPAAGIARLRAAAGDAPSWRLEPLARLEGSLEAFITDAHWTLDADVTVPIGDGRIDFNQVGVSHIGPDSTMGVSSMGVHVDAPNGRTYLYTFSTRHVPGVRFEQRGGTLFGIGASDRGLLEIRPFVEALLNGTLKGDTPHAVDSQLDRTRMSGTLQPGDGLLGNDRFRMQLAGSAQGMNRLALSAAVVGHEVTARVPELRAGNATLALTGCHVRCAGLQGAASMRLRPEGITLHADDLVATDVVLEQPPA